MPPGLRPPRGLAYFHLFQPPGTHGLHPTKSLKRGCQAHSRKEGTACPAPLRSPPWPCGLSETAALRFGGEYWGPAPPVQAHHSQSPSGEERGCLTSPDGQAGALLLAFHSFVQRATPGSGGPSLSFPLCKMGTAGSS